MSAKIPDDERIGRKEVILRLPPDLKDALTSYAKGEQMSVNDVLTRAVRRLLENDKRATRRRSRRVALGVSHSPTKRIYLR